MALTTPSVTELVRPRGLPKAITIWPGRTVSESANVSAGKSRSATLTTARSVSSSIATSWAPTSRGRGRTSDRPGTPESRIGNSTWMRWAPCTTWALVTM